MYALIAGTGDLPGVLVDRLAGQGQRPLICALDGYDPDVPGDLPLLRFRLETLGSQIADLTARGVTHLCLAGAVRRPMVDPAKIDAATAPLVPRLLAALGQGDDGALRVILSLFQEAGLTIVAAHDIAPDLLPSAGVLTPVQPDAAAIQAATLGQGHVADMGRRDSGQACVVRPGQIIAEEGPAGTDAMLMSLIVDQALGAILFKAPKPGQDRRVDLPVIGPQTAQNAAAAGLSGIVIEAGGVMVMDMARVRDILMAHGMFLWIRAKV